MSISCQWDNSNTWFWVIDKCQIMEFQSRCQSPRSSVGGIVGLWENAGEPALIGCLIISLTHSLLIEMRAILIIQKAKYKLFYITRLFIASLTLRLHSTEQRIHKHNTNYTILGLQSVSQDMADNVSHSVHPRRLDPTMELITNSFVLYLQHGRQTINRNKYAQKNYTMQITCKQAMFITNTLTGSLHAILSSNIIFNSLQGLHR